MKDIKIVIGKNFGDEGKGAAVNLLCTGRNALVVRHNGGAQAGHTVETEKFRFVFHQLGSGGLQGCPVYWSRTFLPDLLKLGEEAESFYRAARKPPSIIYAHPDCACVTVYDVLLNSLREELRGSRKHGSCGMGIFETVLRAKNPEFSLFLRDFKEADKDDILLKLRKIRDGYTKVELARLSAAYPESFSRPEIRRWPDFIADENVLYNAAVEMLDHYRKYIVLADWPRITAQFDAIVFENAQGLMLDWDNEEYSPHLTASYTGLKNVAELLKEMGEYETLTPEVIYVTRSYVTRHGAGRLDYECAKEEINSRMADRTNLPNPWQGTLRYGRHPAGEEFFRYIRQDLTHLLPKISPLTTLMLTHLDETKGRMLFSDKERDLEEFAAYCQEQAPGLIHRIVNHSFDFSA